ncbi:MAG: stage III sporulation protein SpoIIIAB [Clostridia bacterium]|nr:stage III sporulation protein SpoIIIAB [Clostridia bacterium]MDD4047783.1 stage III sporulation protein SpoIIIAB [Clostridia bacterium]
MFGAFCIIGGCGYIGFKIAHIYSKRVELFRFLQNGFSLLETEINYSSTPLPLALERVGMKINKDCGSLFAKAATMLHRKNGITASEAWNEGIITLSNKVPLTKEEKELLNVFGHGLGCSDKEEQLKNIALTKKQLYMVEKSVEEEQKKNQKMWQYLGICTGAVIVLILL